jgi:ectoine hydroxylase-related dioxygenase (phytanoyl-CoA dioxygenase family)
LFRDLAFDPRVLQLLPGRPAPVRSILFDKTPDENWPVPWHQDLTIAVAAEMDVPGYGPWSRKDGTVHVQPPAILLQRMATVRIHLDDTSSENGALRIIPGSHLFGKIPSGMVASHVGGPIVTCECRPGDVLVMSPLILHSSRKSLNPIRRRILHFEYAQPEDLDPSLSWHEAGA